MTGITRRTLLVQATLPVVAAGLPAAEESEAARRLDGAFIWTQAEPPTQQAYVLFRKTFSVDGTPGAATLRLFADTRYVLWINGACAGRGPCRFDPKRPEYDILDVAAHLRAGLNTITILVHHAGYVKDYAKQDLLRTWHTQSARVMAHRPGLTAELEFTARGGMPSRLITDASWQAAVDTRHLPSPPTYTSFYDVVDATRAPADSSWRAAVRLEPRLWGPLHPRSIPLLHEEDVAPVHLQLPAELSSGAELVIDCGRAVQAYFTLDFEAVEGARLEVRNAIQYHDTNGVPKVAHAGGTNGDVNRYTARAGRQTWMSTDTFGMKYLVLRVASGRITLHNARITDRRYPYRRLGSFTSGDEVLDRIWNAGVRTVEVCSEDAHVDCADRERAEWLADGYLAAAVADAALAGPGENGRPQYADGRLLRNMLRHMAYSQLPDGRLQPMRPSEYPVGGRHGVIDDYSCLWVQALADLYRRTGDAALARELWPVAVKALDYYLRRRTPRGLAHAVDFVYFNNPLAYVACEGATFNAFLYRSLRDAVELAQVVAQPAAAARYAAAAEALYAAYNGALWDETAGSYRGAFVRPEVKLPADNPPTFSEPNRLPLDSDGRTPPTGHAALLALYYGLVPEARRARVFAFLTRRLPEEKPFPYSYSFLLGVLYGRDTDEEDRAALDGIRTRWAHMTQYEAGTTSEDWHGGSFVHESSAHPSYYLSAYVLGIRTEGPRTARRLVIDPRLGSLQRASGTTLTEFGPVTAQWRRDGGPASLSWEIDNATGRAARVSLRLPGTAAALTLNGKAVLRAGVAAAPGVSIANGRVRFALPPGRSTGSLSA